MYTLGIPKRDYRRATQVLSYESQPSVPYHETLQDDGFYLFTFPEVGSEDDFRDVVVKLKGEGIRVIGADAQLTERQIMKLIDLVPLNEESTGAFGMTSKELADTYSLKMLQQMRDEVMMDMEQQAEPEGGPIADMYGGQLDGLDKAISIKRGETKDVPYDVAIGRMTQDEYDRAIGLKEGTCGYSIDGKPANKPAGPDLLRKAIRQEIRSLNEDSNNKGYQAARKLIDQLRAKTYRSFSDQELDAFSKEMALHFIDNQAAEAAIMMRSAKMKGDDYKPGTTDELPFE